MTVYVPAWNGADAEGHADDRGGYDGGDGDRDGDRGGAGDRDGGGDGGRVRRLTNWLTTVLTKASTTARDPGV
ncbi:hypothetical protein BCD49_06395 [Pseudofrankia sp. EUN1h]|nr:hypothetical protein BCD49_06395 [Pseudofrankia sp. EUN1h]